MKTELGKEKERKEEGRERNGEDQEGGEEGGDPVSSPSGGLVAYFGVASMEKQENERAD